MFQGALNQKWTSGGFEARLEADGIGPQHVPADRQDAALLRIVALQCGQIRDSPAAGARPIFIGRTYFLSASWVAPLTNLATSDGFQPNSTCPRMREPAATVNVLAFRS